MHKLLSDAIESWQPKDPNDKRRLLNESWGQQVRLEKIKFEHPQHKYVFTLAPIKYAYYLAIQARLLDAPLRQVREYALDNALDGLNAGEPLVLPSHFAIHMGITSKEGRALLRQRSAATELYKSAWESGVGEFMHGPDQTDFPHFDMKGQPNLELFLKNAVAEELDYDKARPSDFSIFGFAVEFETLAPKLLVLYRSDADIGTLLRGAKSSKDWSPDVESVEISPDGIAQAVTSLDRFPKWGPTSKLTLMLALKASAKSFEEEAWLIEKTRQLATGSVSDVVSPTLATTSAVVEEALRNAETLIRHHGAASALDRVHTAFHGYLETACAKAGIPVRQDVGITGLFARLRENHPSLAITNAEDKAQADQIFRGMSKIVDALQFIRNRKSLAHPNPLLDEPEARLAVNLIRTMLQYLDSHLR